MKTKSLPRKIIIGTLATGASLILGFLSFGGMFAIIPVLPIAFASFGLSVAYEGEIYIQNIKGSLAKLFKSNYLKRKFANDFLQEIFPTEFDGDTPQFFEDYKNLLEIHARFIHKNLDAESKKQKRKIEKSLKDMEKWFSTVLFSEKKEFDASITPYEQQLRSYLATQDLTALQNRLVNRRKAFRATAAFSVIAGLFMGLGTTYLLVETFAVIPIMATLPLAAAAGFIVPMALVAGLAYGFLTYNAITDLISNDTVKNWLANLKEQFKNGITARGLFLGVTTALLVTLAIALTICTAGTWWTVAKNTKPLFNWMQKIPGFVMGIINPIITGISAIAFNLQNTGESLELIDSATKNNSKPITQSIKTFFSKTWNNLRGKENWLQILNPFRLVTKAVMIPLRVILFFGHLLSIGVTADRVPGIPQIVSALLGIISEGFEDAHYFVPKAHGKNETPKTADLLHNRLSDEHGHDHSDDLPTRFLKLLFTPIFLLSATWDWLLSKRNHDDKKILTFKQAWNKQLGIKAEIEEKLKDTDKLPSTAWQKEQALYRINHAKEKLSHAVIGKSLAKQKAGELSALADRVHDTDFTDNISITENISMQENSVLRKHRFFNNGPTKTAQIIMDLPERVSLG